MINRAIILLLLIAIPFSQGINNYSFNTAESASMAGAIVSSKGGDWSLYNNPATLSDIKKRQFAISSSNLYGQAYLPLSSYGIIIPTKYGIQELNCGRSLRLICFFCFDFFIKNL